MWIILNPNYHIAQPLNCNANIPFCIAEGLTPWHNYGTAAWQQEHASMDGSTSTIRGRKLARSQAACILEARSHTHSPCEYEMCRVYQYIHTTNKILYTYPYRYPNKLHCITRRTAYDKHQRVGSGLQSLFNHKSIRSVMHQTHHTSQHTQESKLQASEGQIRSPKCFSITKASGLWCIKHITPPSTHKKANYKCRRVRSGLQSVFQSQKHQVCDASHTHHTSQHTQESKLQASKGQIRSPKCFSITKASGLWCIKHITPPSTHKKANYKRRRVRSGLQSVFQSQKHQVCDASNTSHLPAQTRKQITSVGGSDQVSKVFFNHKSIRSVMHQTHITPPSTHKKANYKRRRVRSGLQSVFQSQKHQVCDASNTSHLPAHTRKQITSVGGSDQVSKVFFNHKSIRSVMHQTHHTSQHTQESKWQTSEGLQESKLQASEGQIRSPKCFSITKASGLWCIKHITPPSTHKKANDKRRRVRSVLQSVFQSQKHQVCDASNTSHLPAHTRKQITSVGGSDQVSKVFFNHKSIRSVMHQTHHTSQHTQESKLQASEGQIRSPKCFSITKASGLWCIKHTSHLPAHTRKQMTNVGGSTRKQITSVGGSDQVSKVFFNHKSIRSVMHQTHHTSQHTQESKWQASEGQISSPKRFSITKASGLWCIKHITPPSTHKKANYKRRRVRSGLQSVFQSQKHQVCDASNTSHLPAHTRKQITSVGGSDQVSKVFFNHKSIRSVMHQTHHTSQHTQESKLQASEGQIRSPKCFSITKASGLWCIKHITPPSTNKKANDKRRRVYKKANYKRRKVRSGLQSVFQSQKHQVCDASNTHHTSQHTQESKITSVRGSDQVSKVFFNHKSIRSVMHQTHHTSQHLIKSLLEVFTFATWCHKWFNLLFVRDAVDMTWLASLILLG